MQNVLTILAGIILFLTNPEMISGQPDPLDVGESLREPEYYISFKEHARKTVSEFMVRHKIPGLSIALTDRKGIIWSGAFGVRDTVSWLPVNSETIFGTASVTKPITSTIILRAVQKGILDLDVPVTDYLPDLYLFSRYKKHPERKITLRHLLSHRSGLTHEAPLGNNWDGVNCSFEDHITSIYGTWLKHPVGQRYDYSSAGFDLAAFILGRVLGTDYSVCAEKLLFSPLGMARSSLDGEKIISDDNRASGYTTRYSNIPPVFLPYLGGGALYSTADDLARFVQMQLCYGVFNAVRYIDSTGIAGMHKIQWPGEGQIEGSGLGINRWHFFDGRYIEPYRMIHTGGGLGFGSVIEWFPRYGIGIVILNNLWEADPTSLADSLLIKIFSDLGISFKRERSVIDIIERSGIHKTNERFLGNWGIFTISLKDHQSIIQWGKNEPRKFSFLSPSSGYYESGNDEYNIIRFFKGMKGQNDYAVSMGGGIVFNKVMPVASYGPSRKHWDDYCGIYDVKRWGETVDSVEISIIQGHLCSNGILLEEAKRGVFYQKNIWRTCEILDFRGVIPTYRNVRMYKRDSLN
jgi:CubicO group peptidase (beta-lactamase class C family)